MPIATGDHIKIDYSLAIEVITTGSWAMSFETRLYRDAALVSSQTFIRSDSSTGTQRFPLANTQVDTAVSTEIASYQLRVIFTTATNVVTGAAFNKNINAMVFPA